MAEESKSAGVPWLLIMFVILLLAKYSFAPALPWWIVFSPFAALVLLVIIFGAVAVLVAIAAASR